MYCSVTWSMYLVLLWFNILDIGEACHTPDDRGKDRGRSRRSGAFDRNSYFAECMNRYSVTNTNWSSVVDFVINHSTWFDAADSTICSLNTGDDVRGETSCWIDMLGELFEEDSDDLAVARRCVCKFFEDTTRSTCPTMIRKRSLTPRHQRVHHDNDACPSIDKDKFKSQFLASISSLSVVDGTLLDFSSVIDFVDYDENYETNCDGDGFRNRTNPGRRLKCNDCWATRLVSTLKTTSPYRVFARQVAFDLEREAIDGVAFNYSSNHGTCCHVHYLYLMSCVLACFCLTHGNS